MDRRFVAARAALAVALMVGFYGLALAVAGGLAWIPYAELRYADRLHPKLAFFCLAGSFIILRSIVPRRDRFEPPGPALAAAGQPRLLAEIRKVAAATGQAMPSDVYLAPDVNAWVSQRGGVMGFGSRRVMALGLPLLQVLSVSQLRAVLAHEFGHYHGGDVKMGPWIYKTSQALVRTLQGLAGHSGLLSKPFELYARLFFRVSHAVSRHQEHLADILAARVAGAAALAGGLKAVHFAGLAFAPYWAQEVSPVLDAGFLPPLAVGFARFIEQPRIAEGLRQAVEEEAAGGKHDPYDTHPSLRERLAALAKLPSGPAPADAARALALLDGVAELERRLLATLADRKQVQALAPVTWEEIGTKVLLPQWCAFLREHGFALSGVTPAALPSLDWTAVGRKLARSVRKDDADPLRLADSAVGAALGLALARAGFAVEAPPGSPIVLAGRGSRVDLFTLRERLTSRPEERQAWLALCAAAGIAETDLARVVFDEAGG
jgi:Zn-dependent protease with chaperone function